MATITAADVDSTSLTLSQAGAPASLTIPGSDSISSCTTVPNDSIKVEEATLAFDETNPVAMQVAVQVAVPT